MIELLKKYTAIAAPSGSEENLRKVIIEDIKDFVDELKVDNLGNIIAFKKGKNTAEKKVMLDAHMDEVGFMICGIDENGDLRFSNLGGIDSKVIFGKRVKIGDIYGVIGGTAVHLLKGDEKEAVKNNDELRIDIGTKSASESEKLVKIGDTAVFDTEFSDLGEKVCAKALDDRVGCAVLVKIIQSETDYDMWFSFSVQEEIGCRGAAVTSYSIAPDCAITVESTTAADVYGVPTDKKVCEVGNGVALSLMDNGTLYNKDLVNNVLDLAEQNGIKAQKKTAVAGGTNASVIHKSRNGVKMLNLALPCRYIHSPYGVAAKADIDSLYNLTLLAANQMAQNKL